MLYACAVLGDDRAAALDLCRREVADAARRTALTAADRHRGESLARRVQAVLTRPVAPPGYTCEPAAPAATFPPPCRWDPDLADPPGLGDVAWARQALRAAGYAGAVVRMATADDPAPVGSLLYAVPVDNLCIIGYGAQRSDLAGSPVAKGQLPDGSCLSS
jgi:hypothetical protein